MTEGATRRPEHKGAKPTGRAGERNRSGKCAVTEFVKRISQGTWSMTQKLLLSFGIVQPSKNGEDPHTRICDKESPHTDCVSQTSASIHNYYRV